MISLPIDYTPDASTILMAIVAVEFIYACVWTRKKIVRNR